MQSHGLLGSFGSALGEPGGYDPVLVSRLLCFGKGPSLAAPRSRVDPMWP